MRAVLAIVSHDAMFTLATRIKSRKLLTAKIDGLLR